MKSWAPVLSCRCITLYIIAGDFSPPLLKFQWQHMSFPHSMDAPVCVHPLEASCFNLSVKTVFIGETKHITRTTWYFTGLLQCLFMECRHECRWITVPCSCACSGSKPKSFHCVAQRLKCTSTCHYIRYCTFMFITSIQRTLLSCRRITRVEITGLLKEKCNLVERRFQVKFMQPSLIG